MSEQKYLFKNVLFGVFFPLLTFWYLKHSQQIMRKNMDLISQAWGEISPAELLICTLSNAEILLIQSILHLDCINPIKK